MSASIIDEGVPLGELLELEGVREVCRSLGELFGIGIKVFDTDGNKISDVRASTSEHCGYLFTIHETQVLCTNLVSQIRTQPLTPETGLVRVACFSGLEYTISPLVYEGSAVGRLIFGPYAPEALDQPSQSLTQYQNVDFDLLANYQRKVPRAAHVTVDKVVEHVVRVFEIIIHTNHQAKITSKLHVASVNESFKELEQANLQLRAANKKLEELDRLKSNFIATVSHELRTPLTSVIGYSEMLLEGLAGDLNDEQRGYIKTVLEKGESLLSLIGQVLDLSRIESGNVAMMREITDPKTALESALTDVWPQAHKRQIEVTTEVDADIEPILVDPDKLRRVLTNLLGNAVKFTPSGGSVHVDIDIYDTQPEDRERFDIFEPERNRQLRIRVRDTGVGIAEDKLEDIFEAFYQVDNSSTREFGGTGLGLSIVRNFVRAHGGQVDVYSKIGEGSMFTVLLPYVFEELEESASTELLSKQLSG